MTLPFDEMEYLIIQDAFESLIHEIETGFISKDEVPYCISDITKLRDKFQLLLQGITESVDR